MPWLSKAARLHGTDDARDALHRAPATRPTMSAGISARRNSTNSSPSFKRQLAQSGEGRLPDGFCGPPEGHGYWCGGAEQADHHSKQLRDASEE